MVTILTTNNRFINLDNVEEVKASWSSENHRARLERVIEIYYTSGRVVKIDPKTCMSEAEEVWEWLTKMATFKPDKET